MRNSLLRVLFAVVLTVLIEQDPSGRNAWARPDRPVLVVFEEPACGPCGSFRREALAHLWGRGAAPLTTIRIVNYGRLGTAGYALRSHIHTLPTFVLMHRGREISRITGYGDWQSFRVRLREMLARPGPLE